VGQRSYTHLTGRGGESEVTTVAEEPIRVRALESEPGIEIRDRIDDARVEMYTGRQVFPQRVSTDRFRFPMDCAVSVEVDELYAPEILGGYVRSVDGQTETEMSFAEKENLPSGLYEIQFIGTTLNLYLRLSGPVTIETDHDGIRFELDAKDCVEVGIRSRHEKPTGVVRTTDEPRDLARAISTFGSALKTLSTERSFESLRGHPPLLEEGSELSIPDVVSSQESSVMIEVPGDKGVLYSVAPLAYYLGATVELGSEPRVVTAESSVPLVTQQLGAERRISRLLKKHLFLDTVVRTEGLYKVNLHERNAVEESLPFDLASMYDASLPERIAAYQKVPYDLVEPHLPRWPRRTEIEPSLEHVGFLPFAAKRLSPIHVVQTPDQTSLRSQPEELGDFVRDGMPESVAQGGDVAVGDSGLDLEPFRETGETLERVWLGDGLPAGAVNPDIDAFRRQATRGVVDEEPITVKVVCNDRQMIAEADEDLYGNRELVDFDVSVHYDATVAELESILRREVDFFHFIGHVDDSGFRCVDGHLDAETLNQTGTKAFLLNACRSSQQGNALVDAGANGGIVTTARVFNHQATRFGRHAARFLNRGYPLDMTLLALNHATLPANRYTVVGADKYAICQLEGGEAGRLGFVEPAGTDYRYTYLHYPSDGCDIGAIVAHTFDDDPAYQLVGGEIGTWAFSADEIDDIAEEEEYPFVYEGEILWGDEFPEA
jgi:hypothetical protein